MKTRIDGPVLCVLTSCGLFDRPPQTPLSRMRRLRRDRMGLLCSPLFRSSLACAQESRKGPVDMIVIDSCGKTIGKLTF